MKTSESKTASESEIFSWGGRVSYASLSFAIGFGTACFGVPLGILPKVKSFFKATEISRLYANDLPDPFLRYCSKSRACSSVSKAPYQTSFQGR